MRFFRGQIFMLLLLMTAAVSAQDDKNWPPLSYLRNDYRTVKVVAHVRVYEAEIVSRIPGYEDWRIRCEIIEPFKGPFRKGNKIEYYHGAEASFRKEIFMGEKIIFLVRNFHEKEKKWVYAALENSTLPHNEDRAQKLRKIKQTRRKH